MLENAILRKSILSRFFAKFDAFLGLNSLNRLGTLRLMAFVFRQRDAHLRRKCRDIGEGKIAVAYQAQDTVGGVFRIVAQGINEIL